VAAVIAVTVSSWPAHATPPTGTVERRTEPANDVSEARDYLLYRPAHLAAPPQRALVVFLHGCAQTATDAMAGVPWNQLADARGFVVVYPEQSLGVDGNAGHCWNSGQAPVYPRGQHELETIARITRDVAAELSVPPGRVFIAGLSSGALMSAAMAATYPDLYAAIGSVVGCGYPCGDATGAGAYARMDTYAAVVPGFFVTGSADYLVNPAMSQAGVLGWVGANDFADDGDRNDSVSSRAETEERGAGPAREPSTGLCIQNWNNPCPADALGWTDYPTTISRYRSCTGEVIVESWMLHGMSHNYPGGHPTDGTFTDPHGPDITTAMFDFFLAHARGRDAGPAIRGNVTACPSRSPTTSTGDGPASS
jgi:poly(hydroxyalkanoate) depolymerase family esterase